MNDTVDRIAELLRVYFSEDRPADELIYEQTASAIEAEVISPLLRREEKLRSEWKALERIATESIVETDQPDRIRWEGVWYDGPPATAFLSMMRAIQKMARAALQTADYCGIVVVPEDDRGQ